MPDQRVRLRYPFRIRWRNIQVGTYCRTVQRCIAERRILFLGLIPMWWPVENAKWRDTECDALSDIENHKALQSRKPVRYVE